MSAYTTSVLADSPLGYWRLDELSGTTATDSSGNARNGTYTAAVWTQGVAGAIPVDSDKAVSVGTSPATLDFGALATWQFERTSPYSLEFWIKNPGVATAFLCGAVQGGPTIQGYEIIVTSATTFDVYQINDSTGANYLRVTCTSAGSINDGLWHHIVITFSGSGTGAGVKGYVDGLPATNSVVVDALTATIAGSPSLRLANRLDNAIPSPVGAGFDEFAVYGTTLSAARVLAHYNAASLYANTIVADAPSGYWRLDEASGASAFDYSGNARTATYTNILTYRATGALTGDPDGAAKLNTGGKLDLANAATFAFERTNHFSLEFWVLIPLGFTGSLLTLLSNLTAATVDQGYEVLFNAGVLSFYLINNFGGANYIQVNATAAIADAAFHHVVATYDGSSTAAGALIYVDGSPLTMSVASNTLSASMISANTTLIGVRPGAINQCPANTVLDEVAVFPSTLSAARVLAHYNAGKAIISSTNPFFFNRFILARGRASRCV